MNCDSCSFFEASAESIRVGGERLAAGYCHRFPPTVVNPGRSAFPFVHEQLWCGEYRPHQR